MMRDDIEFNIEFCELIEQYPDLYDYTKSGYSNRNVQDKLWREIGVKIGATAKDCKERWKNIRSSYSKSKRNMTAPSGSAMKTPKEYYLAPNLRFLDIYLKSRPPKGNLENNPDQIDDESTSMSAGSSVGELPATDFIAPQQTPPSKGKQINISDVNKSAYEYFSLKNKHISTRQQNMYEEGKGKNVNDDSEADMAFFRSMLPDVTIMTQDQKRKFKFGVLNLIERILKEPNTSHTPYSRSASPYQRYSSRESEYNSPLHVRSYGSPSPRHINTTGANEHPELQQTQPAPQQTQTGAYEHPELQQTQPAPQQTQTGAYEHPELQQTQPAPQQTQTGAYEHPVLQQTQPAPRQTPSGAYGYPVFQQTQPAPRQTQSGAYGYPVFQQTQPAPRQTQSGAYGYPVFQQTQPAPKQTQTDAHEQPVLQQTPPRRARAHIYLPMFSPVTPVSPSLEQIIADGQPQDEVNNFNT